jgi:hypothetical protein
LIADAFDAPSAGASSKPIEDEIDLDSFQTSSSPGSGGDPFQFQGVATSGDSGDVTAEASRDVFDLPASSKLAYFFSLISL